MRGDDNGRRQMLGLQRPRPDWKRVGIYSIRSSCERLRSGLIFILRRWRADQWRERDLRGRFSYLQPVGEHGRREVLGTEHGRPAKRRNNHDPSQPCRCCDRGETDAHRNASHNRYTDHYAIEHANADGRCYRYRYSLAHCDIDIDRDAHSNINRYVYSDRDHHTVTDAYADRDSAADRHTDSYCHINGHPYSYTSRQK